MKQLSNVEIGKMRQLANFLETVPPEDFDLEGWVQQTGQPVPMFFGLIHRQPACGFAGCAMGWAAHTELFPGLRLTRDKKDVCYAGFTGYDAVMALLGISENISYFLFSPSMYRDDAAPGHVARRLRRFVEIVERRMNRKQATPLRIVA